MSKELAAHREYARDNLKTSLLAMLTKCLINDLSEGFSSIIQDAEIEKLLIQAIKKLPVGSALFVCFAPFVRKMIEPHIDKLSDDDLIAAHEQWSQKMGHVSFYEESLNAARFVETTIELVEDASKASQ